MNASAKLLASRKGNLYNAHCPSRSVLDHVTSRWGSLVLLVLIDGKLRFNELVREIGGVSEKMLAQTLKSLEGDGLLVRTVTPTKPPKVDYELTRLCLDAAGHIRALTNWVEDNVAGILKIRSNRSKLQADLASVPTPRKGTSGF